MGEEDRADRPDLSVNEGTVGNWVKLVRERAQGTRGLSKDDVAELKRLRAENVELRTERHAVHGCAGRR